MERNKKASIYVELKNEDYSLLDELPGAVTVMYSAELLHSALRHIYLNITELLPTDKNRKICPDSLICPI